MSLLRFFIPQKSPASVINKHGIPQKIDWKIELNKDGLVATSEMLPGLVTNADNPKELLEMINDAVLEYFNVSKLESDFIFDNLNIDGHGTVQLKQVEREKQLA
jgi:hypothetical protein